MDSICCPIWLTKTELGGTWAPKGRLSIMNNSLNKNRCTLKGCSREAKIVPRGAFEMRLDLICNLAPTKNLKDPTKAPKGDPYLSSGARFARRSSFVTFGRLLLPKASPGGPKHHRQTPQTSSNYDPIVIQKQIPTNTSDIRLHTATCGGLETRLQ